MRAVFCPFVVLGIAAHAVAGEIAVPGDYPTIQAAVDAAAEGDVVVVGPGVYHESVFAVKSGVALRGRGATWDGGDGGEAAPCLVLQGEGNVVSGFRFTGGTDQVTLEGDGCSVLRCSSEGAAGSFVVIEGAAAVVKACRAEGGGDDSVVIDGETAVVARVRVESCEGIGIAVSGDGSSVLGCRVDGAGGGGVSVEGEGSTVVAARATECASFGVDLAGEGSLVLRSRALECGSEGGAGFIVNGDGSGVRASTAVRCTSDGFRVEGDDCTLVRDRAVENEDDGIDIEGGIGVSLTGSLASRNGSEGVENGGEGTDVTGCRFVSNETDLALDGSVGASFGRVVGTKFETGGLLTVR